MTTNAGASTTAPEARAQKGPHCVKTEAWAGLGPPQGSRHNRQPCLFQSLRARPPPVFRTLVMARGHPDNRDNVPISGSVTNHTLKALLSCRAASSWGLGIRRGTSLGRCPASPPDAHRMICSSRQRWQCRAEQEGPPIMVCRQLGPHAEKRKLNPTSHCTQKPVSDGR